MPIKSNKSIFIEKSNIIHDNLYDYTLVDYINNKTKVKIICKEHGVFEQRPDNHIQNQKCPYCINNNIKNTKDNFIKSSIEKYGKLYDYSLVDYKSNKTKVSIICKEHGEFMQTPNNHLSKSVKIACQKCSAKYRMIEFEDIIERCNEIHNNYYDYSKLSYDGRNKKSIIICPKHGEFEQIIHSHLLGSGCRKCSSSNGEKLISNLLNELNIEFKIEHKFPNCKSKTQLKFDFYIPSENVCIEFNGLQHYKEVPFFGGEKSFNEIKKRDQIKKDYCKNNGIKLVIIHYNEPPENIKNIISSLRVH
jgi:hypothetical protein